MRIGIGITTVPKRKALHKVQMEHIKKHTPSDVFIFVQNDTKGIGVAKSKNNCLAALMDAGCTHLFLLDDDETIFIQPFASDDASSFSSLLTKETDGYVLTIREQSVTGGTIRGNIGIVPDYPGANGFYENSTKAFGYAIKVNVSGTDYDEIFQGVKL